MEQKIFVAGFGGQGVVVAGNILAHAAIAEGKYVLGMVSYGVEVRGGASHSFVIISEEEIDSPIVDEAVLGFALSREAFEKFKNKMNPGGTLFVDSSQVTALDRKAVSCSAVALPATLLARDLGNEKVANMIMIGAAIERTRIVQMPHVIRAIGHVFKGLQKELVYINERALTAGAELMRRKEFAPGARPLPDEDVRVLFSQLLSKA
jgi:2-oxoglutarate ferredoxin oxidoreductase subunit gamma